MPPKPGDFKGSTYTRSTALIKARPLKLKEKVTELSRQTDPPSQVQLRQLTGYATECRSKKADFERNLARVINLEGDEAIADTVLSCDQDEIESQISLT